jgi:hypothetical protein
MRKRGAADCHTSMTGEYRPPGRAPGNAAPLAAGSKAARPSRTLHDAAVPGA